METKSSVLFRHWLRANPQKTSSYEMKDTRGKNYLDLREVKDAQLDYANAIKSDRGVFIRVQALSGGEPDYIYLRNEPAWIVIKYPKCFCIIDATILQDEKKTAKRLDEIRARKLSTTCIEL